MRRADASAALEARQAAVAASGVKALMPVGRPFLDYVLSAVSASGYRQVCLVVAPEHEAVRRRYRDEAPPEQIQIELAVQPQPNGTADAVLAAESFAGDHHFLVLNSDNYYPEEALTRLRQLDGPGVALFERQSMLADGNVSEARFQQFAVGRIDAAGLLRQIVEKPDERTLATMRRPFWIGMNCWRFGPSIFEACRNIEPSPRGELEITDAAQYAIDVLDERFQAVTVRTAVLDLTGRADVAAVAARLQHVEVAY